ncbi:unnamed protein product, partial [Adineta ricciae]
KLRRSACKQPRTTCKQCGLTELKEKKVEDHILHWCPKTEVTCPAASNRCPWSGYRDERAEHFQTCQYKLQRGQVREILSQNEHLTMQISQYKDRILKLESDASEAEKKIEHLEERCREYEERIEELMNEQQGTVPYRNIKLEDLIDKCSCRMTIDLRRQRLKDRDMEIVVDKAMKLKLCKRLLLDENQITSQGIAIITDGLKDNTTLETLNLEKNFIGDQGVQYLSNVLLTKNSTIQRLDLNENNITSTGVQYLADLLQVTRNLTWLGLHTNKIGDSGMVLLANVLADHNRSLQVLDLCYNKSITDKCAQSIIDMVKNNRSLKRIHMSGCNLSKSIRDQIRLASNSNRVLEILEV